MNIFEVGAVKKLDSKEGGLQRGESLVKSAQKCHKSYKSRKILNNDDLFTNIGFDTAENELGFVIYSPGCTGSLSSRRVGSSQRFRYSTCSGHAYARRFLWFCQFSMELSVQLTFNSEIFAIFRFIKTCLGLGIPTSASIGSVSRFDRLIAQLAELVPRFGSAFLDMRCRTVCAIVVFSCASVW